MVARPFKNTKPETKFKKVFILDGTKYEYIIYLTPLPDNFPQDEYDEIVEYFGTRKFKKGLCLKLHRGSFRKYLNRKDISAFLIVNPEGVDNYASASLQNYDWCNHTDTDMVWINDICRVSSTGLSGSVGEPLKGLMFLAEQLVVQNLGLDTLKLYIENDPVTRPILKNIYEQYGFIYNSIDDDTICPGFLGGDEIVMEKRGLAPLTDVIDFSFLLKPKTMIKKINIMEGGKRTKKSYKNRTKCVKRRKTSRR